MKWYGKVGYEIQEEVSPGVWAPRIVERQYYGELLRKIRHFQNSGEVNDDVQLNMELRILADAYAFEHYGDIRYVEVQNSKWKISSVQVERPRLVVNFGGVYHDKTY